nr:MAG TPA: hypothetical protein [Crassvirales sp.]
MIAFCVSTNYRSCCYQVISIVIFLVCFNIPILIRYKL